MTSPKGEGYMTPNPVIDGNNYNDSSNISSKNYTESFKFRNERSITKLNSNNLVISKVKRKDKSVGSRRSGLSSSFIKKNKQK